MWSITSNLSHESEVTRYILDYDVVLATLSISPKALFLVFGSVDRVVRPCYPCMRWDPQDWCAWILSLQGLCITLPYAIVRFEPRKRPHSIPTALLPFPCCDFPVAQSGHNLFNPEHFLSDFGLPLRRLSSYLYACSRSSSVS